MKCHLSRDDECDWLDGVRGEFVRARDLAFGRADSPPWDEAHPTLRVARFVLVQRVKVIALVFVVPDISISLASYHTEDGACARAL